jgi:exonuclease SbcD
MLKLLHTADWHLGRVFHHQSLLEDQAYVLEQMIAYAKDHDVDGVLVAGDIYDRSVPPAEAVRLLNQTVNRFAALGVPMIMISGNHDSAERLGFAAEQLEKTGLHILSDLNRVKEAVRLQKDDIVVQVFGIPFADPERVRNEFDTPASDYDQAHSFLVEQIQQARDKTHPSVLMSHCFVDGAQASESEKTLSVGGSERVSFEPMLDFEYVALGHLHAPQYRGAEHIRYSGSPLKYSFSEHQHKKGLMLLSFDQSGLVDQQPLPLKSQRDVRIIEGLLDEVIAQGKEDPNNDDYVMVRLTDTTALLDPMGRLREVYPNALHLEKRLLQQDQVGQANREHIKLDAPKLVADFYQQIQGESLTDQQQAIIEQALNQLNKESSE